MQDDEDKGSGAASGKQSRRDRLKHALRENLKRRKAQARERAEQRDGPREPHDSAGIGVEKK